MTRLGQRMDALRRDGDVTPDTCQVLMLEDRKPQDPWSVHERDWIQRRRTRLSRRYAKGTHSVAQRCVVGTSIREIEVGNLCLKQETREETIAQDAHHTHKTCKHTYKDKVQLNSQSKYLINTWNVNKQLNAHRATAVTSWSGNDEATFWFSTLLQNLQTRKSYDQTLVNPQIN